MKLSPDDPRMAAPWTDGPTLPFLGLAPDADVLLVLHRQPSLNLVEFGIAQTLPRLLDVARGVNARVWVKTAYQDGIEPLTPDAGDALLGNLQPRTMNVRADVALGQALREGWPLPNGRSPQHLVWVSDGFELPDGILTGLAKRKIPLTLFLPVDLPDPALDQRRHLQRQRPGLRAQGLAELATFERQVQTEALRDVLREQAQATAPALPLRRL